MSEEGGSINENTDLSNDEKEESLLSSIPQLLILRLSFIPSLSRLRSTISNSLRVQMTL